MSRYLCRFSLRVPWIERVLSFGRLRWASCWHFLSQTSLSLSSNRRQSLSFFLPFASRTKCTPPLPTRFALGAPNRVYRYPSAGAFDQPQQLVFRRALADVLDCLHDPSEVALTGAASARGATLGGAATDGAFAGTVVLVGGGAAGLRRRRGRSLLAVDVRVDFELAFATAEADAGILLDAVTAQLDGAFGSTGSDSFQAAFERQAAAAGVTTNGMTVRERVPTL